MTIDQSKKAAFWSTRPEFAAKVRWRILYDRNPLLVTLQDKYAVRNYAKDRNVQTTTLFSVLNSIREFSLENIPQNCMIKANHGWQWNILRCEGRYYLFADGRQLVNPDGSLLNYERAKKFELTVELMLTLCGQWFNSRHSSREWAYYMIAPKMLIEELLVPTQGKQLLDFRFYTFHGKVAAINIGSALYRRDYKNIFLDRDWKEIPLSTYTENRLEEVPQPPECLDKMIAVAERLGAGIDFVRVDLYSTTKGIMLGEMTIYPESGNPGTPTGCAKFNQWLGDQWQL